MSINFMSEKNGYFFQFWVEAKLPYFLMEVSVLR
jgi:hypothetical protein